MSVFSGSAILNILLALHPVDWPLLWSATQQGPRKDADPSSLLNWRGPKLNNRHIVVQVLSHPTSILLIDFTEKISNIDTSLILYETITIIQKYELISYDLKTEKENLAS